MSSNQKIHSVYLGASADRDCYRVGGPFPMGIDPATLFAFDGENSILCAECAERSDSPDEVPHFRPATDLEVNEDDDDLCCDHCSRQITAASSAEEG